MLFVIMSINKGAPLSIVLPKTLVFVILNLLSTTVQPS